MHAHTPVEKHQIKKRGPKTDRIRTGIGIGFNKEYIFLFFKKPSSNPIPIPVLVPVCSSPLFPHQ